MPFCDIYVRIANKLPIPIAPRGLFYDVSTLLDSAHANLLLLTGLALSTSGPDYATASAALVSDTFRGDANT